MRHSNSLLPIMVAMVSLFSINVVEAHSQTPSKINKVTGGEQAIIDITVANLNKVPSAYEITIDGHKAGVLPLRKHEFRKISIELDKRPEDSYNETINRQVCSISIPEDSQAKFKTRICSNVTILFAK